VLAKVAEPREFCTDSGCALQDSLRSAPAFGLIRARIFYTPVRGEPPALIASLHPVCVHVRMHVCMHVYRCIPHAYVHTYINTSLYTL